jgi:thiol-disulfide isomerase/thioredoxin
LNEEGVVYYKSKICNNCKRQEALLGEAYKKLNSVECHPDGVDPQPELCLSKGIKKTPTFLIEENGEEVKRLEGLQPLDDLAEWAGVELVED